MFAVEIYAAVRRFVFVEGKSRREAARVFGLSRDTIAKMCRYSAPSRYVRSKAPERPKLGPLVPVIDVILEADKTARPNSGIRRSGFSKGCGSNTGLPTAIRMRDSYLCHTSRGSWLHPGLHFLGPHWVNPRRMTTSGCF